MDINFVGTIVCGSTPTHTYTIPSDVAPIADLRISYGQDYKELVTKTLKDCTIDGQDISVTLSQEDTLKFDRRIQVAQAQLRILTTGNEVLTSDHLYLQVSPCLNSEVLQYEG